MNRGSQTFAAQDPFNYIKEKSAEPLNTDLLYEHIPSTVCIYTMYVCLII